MMDRANYENYIAAFINLSKSAVRANTSKEFIRIVLRITPLVEGKLTKDNKDVVDMLVRKLLYGSNEDSFIVAYKLFRILHTDRNIIKLKDMHAGSEGIKVYGESSGE